MLEHDGLNKSLSGEELSLFADGTEGNPVEIGVPSCEATKDVVLLVSLDGGISLERTVLHGLPLDLPVVIVLDQALGVGSMDHVSSPPESTAGDDVTLSQLISRGIEQISQHLFDEFAEGPLAELDQILALLLEERIRVLAEYCHQKEIGLGIEYVEREDARHDLVQWAHVPGQVHDLSGGRSSQHLHVISAGDLLEPLFGS